MNNRSSFWSRSAFIGIVLLALLPAACSGGIEGGGDQQQQQGAGEDQEGTVVSKEESGKTNVTWWTHNNPAFVKANKEVIKRFEAQNADINIAYTYFPYDVLFNKLQAGYASETVSDIQQMFGSWVSEYARNGLLEPVPQDLASGLKGEFWAPALGSYVFEDKAYGMPNEYNLESCAMLVNPKLVRNTPTTWTDLVQTAESLTKLNEDGTAEQVGFAFSNPDDPTFLFFSMILQQGEDYWADDGVHVDFSTDEAKQAWEEMTGLVTEHRVDNQKWYSGDSFEAFFRGKAAMAMRGPWVIAVGKGEFPKFEFKYEAMPPYVGNECRFAAESGWGEVINAQAEPEVKQAAWEFVDFMHEEENMRDWNITTFTVPALKSLQDDERLLNAVPEMAVPLEVIPNGVPVGPVQDRDRFWDHMNDAFTAVSLGDMEAQEALVQAEERINAMIDENVGP